MISKALINDFCLRRKDNEINIWEEHLNLERHVK